MEKAENRKQFYADKANVKWLGRALYEDKRLWCAYSGTGAEFIATGTDVLVTVYGDSATEVVDNDNNLARIGIYINGKRIVDELIRTAEKTYMLWHSDTPEAITVRIIKLSETAMSTFSIGEIEVCGGCDSNSLRPTEEKEMLVEFIGDSITCGYGVDDEDENHSFRTGTEDVTRAYAYKTAEWLDADYSMVSISGYGMISGYSGDGETKLTNQLISTYYDTIGFSYANHMGKTPQDTKWLFNRREPNVIVLNIGTNDASYCGTYEDRREEYRNEYIRFLKTIRQHNPHARIFCILGIMGDLLFPYVQDAVEEYMQITGDHNIQAEHFAEQIPEDGLVADYHPTERTHQKAASHLTQLISDYREQFRKRKNPLHEKADPKKKIIALTFDDGPNTVTTPHVFHLLKKYNIKASFFLIGKHIDDITATIVRQVYDYGCDIQNHSFTHPVMTELTPEQIREEISLTTEAIIRITGQKPDFFRPPFIAVKPKMFDDIPLTFICGKGAEDWVDTVDARKRAETVLNQSEDGDVILLHDMEGNEQTVEALDIIIPSLLEQGYQFVTISELFELRKIALTPKEKKMFSNVQSPVLF